MARWQRTEGLVLYRRDFLLLITTHFAVMIPLAILGKKVLHQTATFQPLGLWGRVYWYLVLPFHGLIFPKMAKGIITAK